MVKKMAGKVVQRVGIKEGDDLEQEDEEENTVSAMLCLIICLLLACN